MDSVIPTLSTKADVERVRSDLHKVVGEMKAWLIGTILLTFVAIGTIGALVGG